MKQFLDSEGGFKAPICLFTLSNVATDNYIAEGGVVIILEETKPVEPTKDNALWELLATEPMA